MLSFAGHAYALAANGRITYYTGNLLSFVRSYVLRLWLHEFNLVSLKYDDVFEHTKTERFEGL